MKFVSVTPNLIVSHMEQSIAFYRDVLGFTMTQTVPDAAPFVFAMMSCGDVLLFLNDEKPVREDLGDAPSVVVGKSGVGLFLILEGIDDFYASVKDRARVVMPLVKKFYGMVEFSVLDPDGYVLTFAERRE